MSFSQLQIFWLRFIFGRLRSSFVGFLGLNLLNILDWNLFGLSLLCIFIIKIDDFIRSFRFCFSFFSGWIESG